VVHNTALNSSDNLPFYPPDNHHSSDEVYWREGTTFDWFLFNQTIVSELLQSRPYAFCNNEDDNAYTR